MAQSDEVASETGEALMRGAICGLGLKRAKNYAPIGYYSTEDESYCNGNALQ